MKKSSYRTDHPKKFYSPRPQLKTKYKRWWVVCTSSAFLFICCCCGVTSISILLNSSNNKTPVVAQRTQTKKVAQEVTSNGSGIVQVTPTGIPATPTITSIPTGTPTPKATPTYAPPTPTFTLVPSTSTPYPTPTRAPIIHNYGDGTKITVWLDNYNPTYFYGSRGKVDVFSQLIVNGIPAQSAKVSCVWRIDNIDTLSSNEITDSIGKSHCEFYTGKYQNHSYSALVTITYRGETYSAESVLIRDSN